MYYRNGTIKKQTDGIPFKKLPNINDIVKMECQLGRHKAEIEIPDNCSPLFYATFEFESGETSARELYEVIGYQDCFGKKKLIKLYPSGEIEYGD